MDGIIGIRTKRPVERFGRATGEYEYKWSKVEYEDWIELVTDASEYNPMIRDRYDAVLHLELGERYTQAFTRSRDPELIAEEPDSFEENPDYLWQYAPSLAWDITDAVVRTLANVEKEPLKGASDIYDEWYSKGQLRT